VWAANKAVVYQWESRQRRSSPVLWQRVEALTANQARRAARSHIVEGPRTMRIAFHTVETYNRRPIGSHWATREE
jgi:hypothetical protein